MFLINLLIFSFSIIIFILIQLKWGIPWALSWRCRHKYNLIIDIGFIQVGMWYLNLCKVRLKKGNFTVVIDDIGIRSSIFSSEVAKLFSIVINGIRIEMESSDETHIYEKPVTVFNEPVIPPVFLTYVQFVSLQIKKVDAMILRTQVPECLFHAAAEEVRFDGSVIHNARILLLNITLVSATAKLLKHAAKTDPRACLCQLSFNLAVETTIRGQKPLSVEKLYLAVDKTQAIIFDGLYAFTRPKAHNISKKKANFDWKSLFPIIPKTFTLKVDHTLLNGMRDENTMEFSSTLDCFHVNTQVNPSADSKNIREVFGSVQIDNFHVKCNQESIIAMSKFTLDGNYEDPKLNAYFFLDDLHLIYQHHLMKPWLVQNFLHPLQNTPKPLETTHYFPADKPTFDFFKQFQISGCFIAKKVSLKFDLPNDPFVTSCGIEDAKLTLDKTGDFRETSYNVPFCDLLFGKQHWILEISLESVWCKMGASLSKTDAYMLKKYHTWGTPLFIGSVILKCRSQSQNEIKVHSSMDILRTEWSRQFGNFVGNITDCLNEYQQTLTEVKTDISPKRFNSNIVFTFYSTLTSVNMFLLGEKRICMMLRLDKLVLESNRGKIDWISEGFKMVSLSPTAVSAIQYGCVKSNSIKSMCAHIKNARINYKFATKELTAKLQDNIQFQWSANLHLKWLTLFEDLQLFQRKLFKEKPLMPLPKTSSEIQSKISWALKINGEFQFLISLSQKHEILVIANELALGRTDSYTGLETILLKISVDYADIFTFKQLQICRLNESQVVADERRRNEDFILEKNLIWGITIESFKAVFPFEHNYADAVQNELVSQWKWLKTMHRPNKTTFTLESTLPSDLNIEIKEFLFEMSDDPFEIKLRDNYELLEDEYKESLKRQEMLDAKLADLCKSRLLSVPSSKIEELNAGLSKKNAEIYIQRSKQMSQTPARTRLFAWSMTDIHIIALADLSMHGTERAEQNIRDIDPDSPWPEDGLKFSTLWCRAIFARIKEWKLLLRDFRQPWLLIQELCLFGRLAGAEQEATKRAKRGVFVDLGEPWGLAEVERSMTALKFYHDFNCEIEQFRYAFGPCWEPVIAQCNLSFEKISPPSRDPSPPLPWWDKCRLLLHGRLTLYTRQLTMLLHASLDPYNTTEEMELTWNGAVMDWTNGKVVFQGDFNVCVRTASKYDDCRLLYLPNLKLTLKLTWVCLSDPNDHHAVMACAPDKLPEYSSNQEHDSFRAFRSQNLNVSINLETRPDPKRSPEIGSPAAIFYGSTLRWFENLKMILSGVTRPTRRGPVFNNVRPKKKQLSRHYKKVRILISIHRFQVYYWMSFAMQRGFELLGGRILFGSEHILNLAPVDDGLTHRPRAEWLVSYMNCDLNDAEIWLKSALQEIDDDRISTNKVDVEKCYCLSVIKVSYTRETIVDCRRGAPNQHVGDTPAHRLVVYDLKGAWTKSNRDVAFALFDTFIKSKQLKKNLSTESLKGFRDAATKPRPSTTDATPSTSTNPPSASAPTQTSTPVSASASATPASPATQTGVATAASMLQRLIAEIDSKPVVHSDDENNAAAMQTTGQRLRGLLACQEDDVLYKNWLISLINSQVLLKGCETKGYVILSAAKAEILQRVHKPVWKDRTLVSKTTWVGLLECMQYYATVAAATTAANDKVADENIMWLTLDNIQQREYSGAAAVADVSDLVGSGQSVGGVVTETVGAAVPSDDNSESPVQLQRIVSRCKCEFFYAAYGDTSIDPGTLDEVPPLPIEEAGLWERKEIAVDAFTLMHHDLNVCTNSLQYAMILDIVNHLLLYVEPQRKELYERLQRMRFQLALHSSEDQRKPIQDLQHRVRSEVSRLRRLEKETYLLQKAKDESNDPLLQIELDELNNQVFECKESLAAKSEELDLMLSCFKESQISANQKLATMKNDKPADTVRANEIVFKHAEWRLTETDGQLGISDLVLSNFLYTKHSKSDDSVEHLLELGYVNMINLLPNQVYTKVLSPSEIQSNMPVDRKTAVRVFCRERAPVGGISVMEHFEINVVPITIGLTKKFYNTMVAFCFPGRDPDYIDGENVDEVSGNSKSKNSTGGKKSKETNFYVKIDKKDDVEKMKERAEKNKLFIYIKIPEVPVRVSYKGNKEKNIEDIRDFSLVIPTLEYHNVTWTWLDLLLAMKIDSRRVILSQAIKQKLQIKRQKAVIDESVGGQSPEEEDKARILFGTRLTPSSSGKGSKKGMTKKIPR